MDNSRFGGDTGKFVYFSNRSDEYVFLVSQRADGKKGKCSVPELNNIARKNMVIVKDNSEALLNEFGGVLSEGRFARDCYIKNVKDRCFVCCEFSMFLREIWEKKAIDQYIEDLGYEFIRN